tara:strand:- start:104 stop:2926 length:2823 start_codon:yes stop_codon:yes gene_type:complete
MAAPTIPNGEEHFFPVVFSGNGIAQRVGKYLPFTASGSIAKSCLFNNYDTSNTGHYLNKSSMSAGNQQVATFSAWVKFAGPVPTSGDTGPAYGVMISQGNGNWTSTANLHFYMDRGRMVWYHNSTVVFQGTVRFIDTSKWYHVMWSLDVTQATASNRLKMYVDGVELVNPDTDNRSSLTQNTNVTYLNASGQQLNIGSTPSGNGYQAFNGYMAEINYIDGQALTPASFGETDTSTGKWIPSTVKPYPTTTTDIAVTVVSSGGNKYALDGVTQGTVTLIEGATYKFDQSDSSNSGHPLRFSTTSDGTHNSGTEYTTGVTTVGTPGSSGAYTQITVATGAPTLYYYCSNHSGMGGQANTQDQYGTNGFRMQFGTDSALGDDTSGNNYDLTVNGITAADQRTDTPTNNLPIMRPYNISYSQLMYEGALTTYTNGSNKGYPMPSTLRPKSGKWYAECRVSSNGGGNTVSLGVYLQEDMHNYSSGNWYPGHNNGSGWSSVSGGYSSRGFYQQVGGSQVYTQFVSEIINAGDVIGMALDIDNGLLSYYNNSGSLVGSVPFDNNKTPMFAAMSNTSITFIWNFGDNGTFAGYETAGGNADEDGNGNFYHSVPTGFKMLREQSMPETSKGIPGLVWTKDRDGSGNFHTLNDSSRGSFEEIYANSDSYEATQVNSIQKFLKGGYSVLSAGNWNNVGNRFVSWNWVGNGGTTASNSNGSITTTTQVNSTAGFSIIQYTGTEANATIGHGLSQTPDWFMIKALESHSPNGYWIVWHKSFAANQLIYLNLSLAIDTSTSMFNNTLPTSSVINLGGNFNTNMSGNKMLCYAWHEVDGYSKFSSYVGNGSSSDGPFVYTGFRPAWVMWKATDAEGWYIYDTKRNTYNGQGFLLRPDVTNADYDYGLSEGIITLSNGFKVLGNSGWHNTSGQTYLYFAFAENPFVGDGTNPVTAR